MRKLSVVLLVCFMCNGVFASNDFRGVGNWADPNMWSEGRLPSGEEEVKVRGDETVCTLNISTGDWGVGRRMRVYEGATLLVEEGAELLGAGWLRVGASNPGYIEQTGGLVSLQTGRDQSRLVIGDSDGSDGSYIISGGTLTYDAPDGDGHLTLGDRGGTGTFTVVGSGSTIQMNSLRVGGREADRAATGNLEFIIDGLGVAPVQVNDVILDPGGDESTANLILSAIDAPPTNDIVLVDIAEDGTIEGVFDNVNGEPAEEGAQVVLSAGGRTNTYTLTYTSSIALLFESSVTETATVIGDWEDGSYDNWIDWGAGQATIESIGAPKYTFSDIGATLGSSALKVSPGSGWQQNLSIKLQDVNALDAFMSSTAIAIDVTYDPAAWEAATTFAEVYTASLNTSGYGWNDVGGTKGTELNGVVFSDTLNPDAPGSIPIDPNATAPVTGTWTWDYSGILDQVTTPEEGAYAEFIIATNSDGAGAYYFDNARLIGSSPTPQGVDPGTDGLLAAYSLDGNVTDSSGNGNDGVMMGDPGFVDGVAGQALDLDGDGDYVDCGANPLFGMQETNEMTAAAWVTIRSIANQWAAIVAKGEHAWRLGNASLDPRFHFGITIWNAPDTASTDGVLAVGFDEWHHVAGVFDGANIILYVDGALDISVPTTEPIGTNELDVFIGDNPEATGRYWDGLVDEVVIYNRALSEGEIAFLAQ